MKRLFSVFDKKASAVFFFTLLAGLWCGGLFERYVFNFAFVQNFSVAEARQLNGKTVRQTCYERGRIGRIIGYSLGNYAFVRVQIRWENDETSIYSDYPKGYFLKCIEVVE